MAVVLLALLAACSGGNPAAEQKELVAQAAVAVRDGHYDEALVLLDRLDQERDVPATVVSVAQDQRLIAYAGLRRRDELVALSRELADVRGGLLMILGARAALAWVDAGGPIDELEPFFVQVDRSNPFDGQRLRQALATRAQPAAGAPAECLFCRAPGCDMDCVKHATCEFCPVLPKP
jgi:hypothetical protein